MKLSSIKYYLKGYAKYRKLRNTPVIVGGCERSGTSLLQSIVSAHPDIFAVEAETWAFCYGSAAGFLGNKPVRISRLLKALGSEQSLPSCTRWCEKSPANIFYFKDILNYFSGNVKLIYIIRDGRDVVSSMHPGNSAKPWVSIERWVEAVEEGYRYKDDKRVLTIRYEDLITDFENTIKRVCEHIGVNADTNIMNWHQHATIKSSVNLIGNAVNKITNKSIRKFERDDFKHPQIIDEFMSNERAVYFLKHYSYK